MSVLSSTRLPIRWFHSSHTTDLLSDLKLMLLNARSINNMTALIHDLILDEEIDLACIAETSVSTEDDVNLSLMSPRFWKSESASGGVAGSLWSTGTAVSSPLKLIWQQLGMESLYVMLGNCERLGLLLVYCPSCCPILPLPGLVNLVSEVGLEFLRLVILRDFNIYVKVIGDSQHRASWPP